MSASSVILLRSTYGVAYFYSTGESLALRIAQNSKLVKYKKAGAGGPEPVRVQPPPMFYLCATQGLVLCNSTNCNSQTLTAATRGSRSLGQESTHSRLARGAGQCSASGDSSWISSY